VPLDLKDGLVAVVVFDLDKAVFEKCVGPLAIDFVRFFKGQAKARELGSYLTSRVAYKQLLKRISFN
jgi:hypothetical protein